MGAFTEDDVRRILCNPIYVGMGPYSQTIAKEQWIAQASRYIDQHGAESFLTCMLDCLREAFEPGATPFGYRRAVVPKDDVGVPHPGDIGHKIEDQTIAAVCTYLRAEHERCFVQQHAVDKSAAELADAIERGAWKEKTR
jgi:hypothetical protein